MFDVDNPRFQPLLVALLTICYHIGDVSLMPSVPANVLPNIGYRLAEYIGLEAYCDEHGASGCAHFLEDGRLLKMTNRDEAATALALSALQRQGHIHPAPVL